MMKLNLGWCSGMINAGGRNWRRSLALGLLALAGCGSAWGQAPVFSVQPASNTTISGNTATFGPVAASGGAAFTWQLSTNGGTVFANITSPAFSGNTTNTLSALAVNTTENGWLVRALAINGTGTTASTNATLLVPPLFTTQPASNTTLSGNNATFTVVVSATPAATLAWQLSTNGGTTFANITSPAFTGNTGTTLTALAVNTTENGWIVRVVATNTGGASTSTNATLTVPPAITTQPGNVTVTAGGTATFTSAVSGTPSPTFQWQISTNGGTTWSNITNGGSFSGSTTATLTVSGTTSALNGNSFRLLAINSGGTTTGSAASLTVNAAPTIILNPLARTHLVGQTTTFTGAASGNPAPTLRWQVSTDGGTTFGNLTDGANITGSATPGLVLANLTQAMSGNEYRLQAVNFLGTANSTAANLTVETPPSIATQPTNVTVVAGGTANFTVVANGTPAVTYQWQVSANGGFSFGNLTDDANITGSATANLSIANVGAVRNGHQYQCVVTNAGGTVTTNVVVLTVQFAPAFTTAPANLTVNGGDTATFTVATSGNPAPTLQWQVSTDGGGNFTNVILSGNIIGNTSTTLILLNTPLSANGDQFRCVATNSVAATNSTAAVLTVNTPPTITVQPTVPAHVNGLTPLALSVTVTGTNPIAYQWMQNGVAIPGATSSTYIVLAANATNSGNYSVLVSNVGGNVTSITTPTVTVAMKPVVGNLKALTKNPVKRGTAAQFLVTAYGVQPVSYQWLKNGKRMVNNGRISGANGLELTIAHTNITDVGNYSVKVTNTLGSITSATLPLAIK